MKTLFAGMVGLAVFGAFAGPADSRGGAAKSERAAPRESNVRRFSASSPCCLKNNIGSNS